MRNRKHDTILLTSIEPSTAVTEAYRNLRASLTHYAWDKELRTIVFTSPNSNDGTSTLLANLAALTAQDYKKVLLIDGQLRKPRLHQFFRVSNRMGLTDILDAKSELKEVIIETDIEHLYLLPAGPIRANAAELLGTHYLAKLLEQCKQDFDVVLIDSPAVLPYSDSRLWARSADGIVIVVRNLRTRQEQLASTQNLLAPFKDKLLGIIMVK